MGWADGYTENAEQLPPNFTCARTDDQLTDAGSGGKSACSAAELRLSERNTFGILARKGSAAGVAGAPLISGLIAAPSWLCSWNENGCFHSR